MIPDARNGDASVAAHSGRTRRALAVRFMLMMAVSPAAYLAGCNGTPSDKAAADKKSPQAICSSKENYRSAAQLVNDNLGYETVVKPLTTRDFSVPMVEQVDKDTGLTVCSAQVAMRAKDRTSLSQLYPHGLPELRQTEDGFSFRIRFSLQEAADGSGSQIRIPDGRTITLAAMAYQPR